jgi:L-ascorbate metabolism protein UlaG (beta-lactamase superfamily)
MSIIEIKYFGQSAFQVNFDDEVLLIDPWFNKNSISPVKADNFKKVDLIAVTHGHNDHFGDSAEIMRNTNARLICSPEIGYYMLGKGFETCERIAQGGTVQRGKFRVTAVNAIHPCALFGEDWPEDETRLPGGAAFGFVVRSEDSFSIYHAGDTDIFEDMRFIESRYHPNVAILPIGGRFTMDWETAVESCALLKPQVVIPMHFNSTPFLQIDESLFVKKMNNVWPEIRVVVLEPGESYIAKAG